MKHESENLYIKRRQDGIYGLYTVRRFYQHEPIIDINSGNKQDESDFRSIETDAGHFMHPEGIFTNHSCDPTAYVDKEKGFLRARFGIPAHTEVTFDYIASESDLKSAFTCKCEANNCFGKIGTDR